MGHQHARERDLRRYFFQQLQASLMLLQAENVAPVMVAGDEQCFRRASMVVSATGSTNDRDREVALAAARAALESTSR